MNARLNEPFRWNSNHFLQLILFYLFAVADAPATVLYVDLNNTSPTPPYTNWATAAVTIQDAVDAAVAGDQILVSNGVYQTGGRVEIASATSTSNRVAVTEPVAVQSVNGPQFTVIQGYQVPGTTNGPEAIRCVYLADGASLSGFTLTNGAVAADDLNGISAGVWCESGSAFVTNCVIVGNSTSGSFLGTLNNCIIADNEGRGAIAGTLNNCTITGNQGGGSAGGTLNNCILSGNSGYDGGGAHGGLLNSCILSSNLALWNGGGAYESTLNNCTLRGNSAFLGGGATSSTLNNCTIVGNFATEGGGGVSILSTLVNCIVYGNTTPGNVDANYDAACTLNYCCTMPLPTDGSGNATNAPLFIDLASGNLHLQLNSPCIDAGTNLSGSILADIDGRPRPLDGDADGVATFDIGAYEHAVLFVRPDSPSPAPPYGSWLTAATNIQDAADLTLAGAGDEILVTNGVYLFGGRTIGRVVLDKALTTLRSVNGPENTIINGGGAVRCAYLENGTLLSGFTLTNGVAANNSGGGVVFAGFPSDAVVSNCVIIANSATYGGGAGWALGAGGSTPYGGTLINSTLLNNAANQAFFGLPNRGGAADNCTLLNCVMVGNSCNSEGGAVSASALTNCFVSGNTATATGGAATGSWLYNCVVSSNFAGLGATYLSTLLNCTMAGNPSGGAFTGFLTNCIVYDNAGFNEIGATLNYCCTTPMPGNGTGNFTNAPLFVDQAAGNLRLQSNSPCINAGDNAVAPGSTDLDANARIVAGTVDMGAYECPAPALLDYFLWAQSHGVSTSAAAISGDHDSDRMNNWQEWIAGTIPTDASSALRMLNPIGDLAGVSVSWQSVSNRTYFIERAMDLGAEPSFSLLTSNLVGQLGTTTYTDTNAVGPGPFLYRVGVQQ